MKGDPCKHCGKQVTRHGGLVCNTCKSAEYRARNSKIVNATKKAYIARNYTRVTALAAERRCSKSLGFSSVKHYRKWLEDPNYEEPKETDE